MGMIGSIIGTLFGGGGGNVIKETVEAFRPNAENEAQRNAQFTQAALAQFASEFAVERKGWFDRLVDGLNRLPRPLMALGTLFLFVAAMYDPIWFAARMQGIVLIPEPLWWLLGAVVAFYFGGRHQAKAMSFQKSIAETTARTGEVIKNLNALGATESRVQADWGTPGGGDSGTDVGLAERALSDSDNEALEMWRGSASKKGT